MRHTSSSPETIEVDLIATLEKFGMNTPEFKKYFNVTKNVITVNEDCVVELDTKNYMDDIFVESKDFYSLPGIITINIVHDEKNIQFTLPFNHNVNLIKPNDIEINGSVNILKYVPGEKLIEKYFYEKEVNVSLIMKLLDGQTKFIKNPEILVMSLNNQMQNVDLVHFETITQNMLRDTEDPTIPARLTGYKSFIILGQKQLPFVTSWLTALSFENTRKAIRSGLLSGKDAEENDLEKIVSDNYGTDDE